MLGEPIMLLLGLLNWSHPRAFTAFTRQHAHKWVPDAHLGSQQHTRTFYLWVEVRGYLHTSEVVISMQKPERQQACTMTLGNTAAILWGQIMFQGSLKLSQSLLCDMCRMSSIQCLQLTCMLLECYF